MKKFFCLLAFPVLIASCTSSKIENNTSSLENKNTSNSLVVSAANKSNANAEPAQNANVPRIRGVEVSKETVEMLRGGKKNLSKENTPIAESVSRIAVPAPDDSEISSQMNERGEPVETRIFRKNPTLLKVERINLDNQNIKVYLKNGKVVMLPEGRIKDFLSAPANDILKAIDIAR